MSKTTRNRRGRCIALAAVTAGVSWFTTGPAMAGPSPASDSTGESMGGTVICQPPTGNTQAGNILNRNTLNGRTLTERTPAGFTALAPATAVLSITDAAGAAAGQGMRSLPGRSTAAPQPGRLAAAPAVSGLAPASSGAVLPAAKAPAVPILDVMPTRPSVSNALCLPTMPTTAARIHPRPQDRVHPITQTNPKEQSQQPDGPRAQEGTSGTLPGSGASGASRDKSATTGAETARRPNGQTAGQHRTNRRADAPRSNRGERRAAERSQPAGQSRAVPPRRQQEGVNQTATGGQRGTARTGTAQAGARRNGRHHRQHPGQAGQPASSATAATDSAAPPRRAKREGRVAKEGRLYPKAPTVQQDAAASGPGDITAPDLSTGTHPLVDLAGSAGRHLLP